MIYLDNASTVPMHPQVIEEIAKTMKETWANPSSAHLLGQKAKQELEQSRDKLAELLEVEPVEIIFTSGATESNNLIIKGRYKAKKGKIITTKAEHYALLEPCEELEREGAEVIYLPLDKWGRINPEDTINFLTNQNPDDISIVSIMLANNELGTINDLKNLGRFCEERGILFHSDAVCAGGSFLDIRPHRYKFGSMTLAPHKFGGPRGIGILYLKKDIVIHPEIIGGNQERRRRSGTENLTGVKGMLKSAEIRKKNIEENKEHIEKLRNELEEYLIKNIEGLEINNNSPRLVGHLHITLPVDGESLLMRLALEGICISTGSACSAGSLDISHVLLATGMQEQKAKNSIRITIGPQNTIREIEEAGKKIVEITQELKQIQKLF